MKLLYLVSVLQNQPNFDIQPSNPAAAAAMFIATLLVESNHPSYLQQTPDTPRWLQRFPATQSHNTSGQTNAEENCKSIPNNELWFLSCRGSSKAVNGKTVTLDPVWWTMVPLQAYAPTAPSINTSLNDAKTSWVSKMQFWHKHGQILWPVLF